MYFDVEWVLVSEQLQANPNSKPLNSQYTFGFIASSLYPNNTDETLYLLKGMKIHEAMSRIFQLL